MIELLCEANVKKPQHVSVCPANQVWRSSDKEEYVHQLSLSMDVQVSSNIEGQRILCLLLDC